jgi:TonB family protein
VPQFIFNSFHFKVTVPVFLLAALSLTSMSLAQQEQQPPPVSEQTFAALVDKFAIELQSYGVKRIFIQDFEDPNKQVTPFGAWLADQCALVPADSWRGIEVIHRERIVEQLKLPHTETIEMDKETARDLAESLKAVAVRGSYSAAENGIGVTFTAIPYPKAMPLKSSGKIALTEEMRSHLIKPLESLAPKDGVFMAGEGGVGVPVCEHCPNPHYPEQAARRGAQGVVVLSAVVTAQGRTRNISITKKLDAELDHWAVEAVRAWRFKPALNVDQKPVSVRTPIDVSFRLY